MWVSNNKWLVLILGIAVFFRFFRLFELQFWSTDEELIAHFARKIVIDKKIFLISPNYTIAASLGSAFHMFTGVLYWISRLNPQTELAIGSILGVVNVWLIYKAGTELKNKRLGLIAGLFYAASFLISSYDRRWWTLTVAPFFTSLSIYSLSKMLKGKYEYMTLLSLSIISAWQIDPNLGIIPVGTFLCFLFFKIPFFSRKYLWAFVFILLSFVPLGIFEMRHPGTLIQPLFQHSQSASRSDTNGTLVSSSNATNLLWRVAQVYSQYLLSAPTPALDAQFNWKKELIPYASPLAEFMAGSILVISGYPLLKKVLTRKADTDRGMLFLWLYFGVFICSLSLFSLLFHRSLAQHYFHVSIPIFLLLFAYGLDHLFSKWRTLLPTICIFYLGLNFFSLLQSRLVYPLEQKIQLVNTVISYLKERPFSLYTVNSEDFVNNGFTGLFVLNGVYPVRSSDYLSLDWWYRTQSLYFTDPANNDPATVVIMNRRGNPISGSDKIQQIIPVGNMEAVILDNSSKWYGKPTL
jgi:hypothetical protein